MTFSDYLAILALVISITSIIISWYFGFRDKAILKTSAQLYSNENYDYIMMTIINVGRRTTFITMSGCDLDNGSWVSSSLGEKGKGIRLEEHQSHEEKFESTDVYYSYHKGEEVAYKINFWFEDALGERHLVKNSEKLMKRWI